jgi:SLAP domain-containing protein
MMEALLMGEKQRSIFSRLFGRKDEKTDVVSVPSHVEEQEQPSEKPTVAAMLNHTMLVLTEEQAGQYSDQEVEELQKKLNSLPPLPVGQFDFHAFEVFKDHGGLVVRLFIRNARDLQETIRFSEFPLALYDATGEKVAFGVHRMENFGTLGFGEARVWTFKFEPSQVLKQYPDLSEFRVAFV